MPIPFDTTTGSLRNWSCRQYKERAICSEICTTVWNLEHEQKGSLLTVWEVPIYYIHTMDLLKSMKDPFVTQDLALNTVSTNCNPKHLFICLTWFRSQGKASLSFLPYIFKIKCKFIQTQWKCVGGPTARLRNDHCFGEQERCGCGSIYARSKTNYVVKHSPQIARMP